MRQAVRNHWRWFPSILNEHGDPQILFHNFNENNILNNWEEHWQKSTASFLANEINTAEGDKTGSTAHVQVKQQINNFFGGNNGEDCWKFKAKLAK